VHPTNFIQNTNILIPLEMQVPKTKDLSAQLLTITSKVGFQTMFFFYNINFVYTIKTATQAINEMEESEHDTTCCQLKANNNK